MLPFKLPSPHNMTCVECGEGAGEGGRQGGTGSIITLHCQLTTGCYGRHAGWGW
jgi:hypothetical protein